MLIVIVRSMKRQNITCVIVDYKHPPKRMLQEILTNTGELIDIKVVSSRVELLQVLEQFPGLVFCMASLQGDVEQRLSKALYRYSPDSVLVRVSYHEWRKPLLDHNGTDVFTVTTHNEQMLANQIEFLLRFASIKQNFRTSKHLLSIAELRCQWLVDYSREAVAYIAGDEHLYVNSAYLALFGFQSDQEALSTPVHKLLPDAEQANFTLLAHRTQKQAQPLNKTLLHLQRIDTHAFRAEVRFIPAVFRHRRCIQLHIHPVRIAPVLTTEKAPSPSNPWLQHEANTEVENKATVSAPIVRQQLHEALNLRVGQWPSLFIVDNLVSTTQGKHLNQQAFIQQMTHAEQRVALDLWNIRNILTRLLERQGQEHRPKQAIWMMLSVGEWVLNHPTSQAQLLTLLQAHQAINAQLVLALQHDAVVKNVQYLKTIMPKLKASGVKLALEHIGGNSKHLFAICKALSISAIRLSADFGVYIARQQALPPSLEHLVSTAKVHELAVIIDGVSDITSMNLLSLTDATYLQGPILARFE